MPTPVEILKDIFTPRPGDSPGLFQASATIISIAAIYLYFTGYVFCYTFYFTFYEVSLESLDLSPQFYMMRSFTALDNALGVGLVVVLVFTVLGYLHGKVPTWITVLVMIAAFPALFYISSSTATRNARENMCAPGNSISLHFKEAAKKDAGSGEKPAGANGDKADSPAQEQAAAPAHAAAKGAHKGHGISLDELAAADEDSTTRKDLEALGEKGKLALLLETKDRILLFRSPGCHVDKGQSVLNGAGHVYTVAQSDLEFSNISVR